MFKIIILGLLVLGGISQTLLSSALAIESVPSFGLAETMRPCLDPGGYRPVKSVDIFQKIGDYYLVDLLIDQYGSEYHGLKVLLVENNQCVEVFSDTFEKYQPLSAVMSLDAAKQIRYAWEKRMIDIYDDREVTQEWLITDVKALSRETQWVYSQLGFKLRSDIKTCPEETPGALYCF